MCLARSFSGYRVDLCGLGAVDYSDAVVVGMARIFGANVVKVPSAIVAIALGLLPQVHAAESSVVVGDFSKSSLAGWEGKAFKGETAYRFVFDPAKKQTVLQATSDAAASGRFHKQKIDLTKTPFLNWSWKVSDPLVGNEENTKAGDDFSALIYVVVERGIM